MKFTESDFLDCVKNHQMEILKDDGLYRHLVFSNNGSFQDAFELITWPGYLCFCGDRGDFVFQRLPDMFQLFRGKQINPQYWSEKVVAACRCGVEEFSQEKCKQVIRDHIDYLDSDAQEESKRFIWAEVDEFFGDRIGDCNSVDDFLRLVEEFNDTTETDCKFEDMWECDFNEYTHRFLWACFAIQWGVNKYDNVSLAK